ncbi:WG repeat-containing protein [Dysgonomonas sp. OttesenSCG-928-M03]|nr:WG repeat-containing protein [Dysgonomonas sp. OttesenSCG-928-M03]
MVRRRNSNNYNQVRGKSPVPLIIGILVIIFLVWYYLKQEEIDDKVAEWKSDFYKVFDDGKKSDTGPLLTEDIVLSPVDSVSDETSILHNDEPLLQISVAEEAREEPKGDKTQPLTKPSKDKVSVAKPEIKADDKKVGYRLKEFVGDNGKRGLKDMSTGNVVIEPQYDAIGHLDAKNTQYIPAKKGRWSGIIDINNRIVLPFEYEYIGEVKSGKYREVKKDSKYGLVSASTGKLLLPVEYDDLEVIGSSFFMIRKNGLYGCVNDRNEVIVPIIYKGYGYVYKGRNQSDIRIEFRDENGNPISFNTKGQLVRG